MPVPAYYAKASDNALSTIGPAHVFAICAGLVGVAALALYAARQSPGGGIKVAAATTEALPLYTFEPPPEHPVVGVAQLDGGYNWHPVRYPANVGQEITAFIHGGWPTLRMPHERDITWLTCPPGEVSL